MGLSSGRVGAKGLIHRLARDTKGATRETILAATVGDTNLETKEATSSSNLEDSTLSNKITTLRPIRDPISRIVTSPTVTSHLAK